MSTIPETLRSISSDIQGTFEELIKLLLRKSLNPSLNSKNTNRPIVYNAFLGRYERGYQGSATEDCVNRYTYLMTSECIGWNGEILTNFKVIPKFTKNPTASNANAITNAKLNSKHSYQTMSTNLGEHKRLKTPSVVSPIESLRPNGSRAILNNPALPASPSLIASKISHHSYEAFLDLLTSRHKNGITGGNRTALSYTCDIPYTLTFTQFEAIGNNIIDQTDHTIHPVDSAKMSTAMLRVKLYLLESALANLSVENPMIYDSYLEMQRIINSAPRHKVVWVIQLIAELSFQNWECISEQQQRVYLEALGPEFIDAVNGNELITILLQSDSSELIITSSYLFSLLKMLFIVFGYSKLTPLVVDEGCGKQLTTSHPLANHAAKYKGATFRRGDFDPNHVAKSTPNAIRHLQSGYAPHSAPRHTSSSSSDCECCGCEHEEKMQSFNPVNTSYAPPHLPPQLPACEADVEQVDPAIYEFIKQFGDLYPTLVGLMGGTEEFPPESIQISCKDIPANYNSLTSLPEYLWRFNDFSYCRYLEHYYSNKMSLALSTKIGMKARYLQSM